jgi:hypothetical protein
VHQGDWGTLALNVAVQKALADVGLLQVKGEWYEGRPVMVTRNDAQLGVFNGDVGVVLPGIEGKPKVWFLDGEVLRSVSVMRLAQVDTAFVMTVHKSQGSSTPRWCCPRAAPRCSAASWSTPASPAHASSSPWSRPKTVCSKRQSTAPVCGPVDWRRGGLSRM